MTVDRDPHLADKQAEVKTRIHDFVTFIDTFTKQNPKLKNAFADAPSAIKANRNHMQIILDDMLHGFVGVMAETIENSGADFDDIPSEFYIQLLRDRHGPTVKRDQALERLHEEIDARLNGPATKKEVIPDLFKIINTEIGAGELGAVFMHWESIVEGFAELMMQGQALAAANASEAMTQPLKLAVINIQRAAAESGQLQGAFSGAGGPGDTENVAEWVDTDNQKITFDDVAGIDEAKQEVEEVIDFLKNPEKYQERGARMPGGILLHGKPGTGKTLMAKAVAGEAGVPFARVSGSEFVEKYVGVGAARVRALFKEAKEKAPCVIFIDEIDGVGKTRGGGGGGNEERDTTLNQILVEMDGMDASDSVIVIAATNMESDIDPALLRPGRFDRSVEVPLPDLKGREAILKVHTKNKKTGPDVDLMAIARATTGFSGADLEGLSNEAAIRSIREDHDHITQEDFMKSRDDVRIGKERKLHMTPEEVESVAYHEIGHALLTLALEPHSNPFTRVTIVPRGRALGVSMTDPKDGIASQNYMEMLADLRVTMGGRAAEQIIYGEHFISSGASNDIGQATQVARAMVTQWGFSKDLGKVNLGTFQSIFSRAANHYEPSDETKAIIDREVKTLIDDAYEAVVEFLKENKDVFEEVTQELVKKQTLTRSEILDIVDVKTLKKGPLDKFMEEHAKSDPGQTFKPAPNTLVKPPSDDGEEVADNATARARPQQQLLFK